MEQIYNLKLESDEVNELYTALAKAQSEMCIVAETSSNPFYKSKYAKLDQMVKLSRPELSKHGLSILFKPLFLSDGSPALKTILGHSSGQWTAGIMKIEPLKKDHQGFGSALTYGCRQMYKCLTGVVCGDDDDDGEAAMIPYRKELNLISNDQMNILLSQFDKCPDMLTKFLKNKKIESLDFLHKDYFDEVFNAVSQYNKNKINTAP